MGYHNDGEFAVANNSTHHLSLWRLVEGIVASPRIKTSQTQCPTASRQGGGLPSQKLSGDRQQRSTQPYRWHRFHPRGAYRFSVDVRPATGIHPSEPLHIVTEQHATRVKYSTGADQGL